MTRQFSTNYFEKFIGVIPFLLNCSGPNIDEGGGEGLKGKNGRTHLVEKSDGKCHNIETPLVKKIS